MMMAEADVAAADSGAHVEQEVSVPLRPEGADPAALIAFILERFHAAHRRELPELMALALSVERAHAAHPDCPKGLSAFLGETLQDLDAHMQKEERMLFPALIAGGTGCAPFAMRRMRQEHVEHEARLKELRLRTKDFTPPKEACASWVRLYAGCEKLHDDLRAHIETENDELFPMFE